MSKQEEIKQALAAATRGPWAVYRDKSLGETLIGTAYDHPQLKAPDSIVGHVFSNKGEYVYIRDADAVLIAKAPEYIAYLLAENERLRKELEEKEELAEKRLLEAQDWEDEYHAMKRRYEELDRSALEKHELLMDTSAKFQAVSKELEEAWKATLIEVRDKLHGKILLLTVEMDYAEPDEWKLLNIKYEAWAEEWKYLTGLIGDGQEGEGNQ